MSHAGGCRMSRHLEAFAGVGDGSTVDLQDRKILIEEIAGQKIFAVGCERDSLRQTADLDILRLGYLLAVDLQDREAAVSFVEVRLLHIRPAQDGGDRQIPLRA